ncbi:MAG: RsmB/NOP family class I SAM-dependent RNA methyltransferase [Archangium sp.]|nr:RsmB/NOP family class I SAM-dependent RNA methyltransferase [Archangium sp.]MDP3154950.1 RsmB/NOP family class I SAM-dependent RNA methyltransferase [Archangium sp.]MDP3576069.1 RsmB/NOP family class I SAM-dependent RNA methyltransferase [Archangium sp.]
MLTEAELRLTTVPWPALEGLGPILAPALSEILSGTPAERALDKLLRAHRDFTPDQRAVCAESLFGVGLWRRRLRAQVDGDGLQLLAVLALELGGFTRAAEVLGVELHAVRPVPTLWRDRYSFPDWIADQMEARFGDDAAAMAEALNRPGPVCLRARGSREELQKQLAAASIETTLGRWASQALVVTTRRPNLFGLAPQFLGRFEVQDEGSQLLGELVDARPGDEVLDLCAGAGGKALQLAAIVGPQGKVHATDVDLPRLERLRTRAAKANARVLIHGATAPASLMVSRVLIDAPCSELGSLRRGPDLRWRLDAGLVNSMPAIQRGLIETGLRHLAPGGRLVYATCTFTLAENEGVIDGVLNQHPELRVVRPAMDAELIDSRGFLNVAPHRHGTDAFFGAVLQRIEPLTPTL